MNKRPQDSESWLRSLPDHMLDVLAEDGNEKAWRIVEQRREEYRYGLDPESSIPMGEFDR